MMLSDVCLSVFMSVAYIGPKSRTKRPRKAKIGTEVAPVARDSDTTFKDKGQGHLAVAYWGGLPPTAYYYSSARRLSQPCRQRLCVYVQVTNFVFPARHTDACCTQMYKWQDQQTITGGSWMMVCCKYMVFVFVWKDRRNSLEQMIQQCQVYSVCVCVKGSS